MPNSRFHLGVAQHALKVININKPSDFYVGNVFPDAPWLAFDSPLKISIRTQLHDYKAPVQGMPISISDVQSWLLRHAEEVVASDFMKGQFLHLLLDANSNTLWTSRAKFLGFDKATHKDIYTGVLNWEELVRYKWKDCFTYSTIRFTDLSEVANAMSEDISNDLKEVLEEYSLYDNDIQKLREDIINSTADTPPAPARDLVIPRCVTDTMVDLTITEYADWLNMIRY